MATYASLFSAFVLAVKRSGRTLPVRLSPFNLALLAVGTYKASRDLTRDFVTSQLRVTRFEEATESSAGRLAPRATGLRHAIGELVTCPYCMDQWLATIFACALVLLPSWTRLVGSAFAIRHLADVLHLATRWGRGHATRRELALALDLRHVPSCWQVPSSLFGVADLAR